MNKEARIVNTSLVKVAVHCSASIFVVKIAIFAKPITVASIYLAAQRLPMNCKKLTG
jgi:hypothetical protein